MSRYTIDKFLRLVNMDRAALHAYVADPAGFVASWTASWPADASPRLTDQERRALERRDYGALYGLGAHPYLLWSFAEAVWVPEISRAELVERYRVAAQEHGYPDFST